MLEAGMRKVLRRLESGIPAQVGLDVDAAVRIRKEHLEGARLLAGKEGGREIRFAGGYDIAVRIGQGHAHLDLAGGGQSRIVDRASHFESTVQGELVRVLHELEVGPCRLLEAFHPRRQVVAAMASTGVAQLGRCDFSAGGENSSLVRIAGGGIGRWGRLRWILHAPTATGRRSRRRDACLDGGTRRGSLCGAVRLLEKPPGGDDTQYQYRADNPESGRRTDRLSRQASRG